MAVSRALIARRRTNHAKRTASLTLRIVGALALREIDWSAWWRM
jgi:hypothetical protein